MLYYLVNVSSGALQVDLYDPDRIASSRGTRLHKVSPTFALNIPKGKSIDILPFFDGNVERAHKTVMCSRDFIRQLRPDRIHVYVCDDSGCPINVNELLGKTLTAEEREELYADIQKVEEQKIDPLEEQERVEEQKIDPLEEQEMEYLPEIDSLEEQEKVEELEDNPFDEQSIEFLNNKLEIEDSLEGDSSDKLEVEEPKKAIFSKSKLKKMNRNELEAAARIVGIENPENIPNVKVLAKTILDNQER